MKNTTKTIVKQLSTEVLNAVVDNYNNDYSIKEQYQIAFNDIITAVDDAHAEAIISKYERSIGRKSKRFVREYFAGKQS